MEQKCKKMDIISEDNRHPGDPMYDCMSLYFVCSRKPHTVIKKQPFK